MNRLHSRRRAHPPHAVQPLAHYRQSDIDRLIKTVESRHWGDYPLPTALAKSSARASRRCRGRTRCRGQWHSGHYGRPPPLASASATKSSCPLPGTDGDSGAGDGRGAGIRRRRPGHLRPRRGERAPGHHAGYESHRARASGGALHGDGRAVRAGGAEWLEDHGRLRARERRRVSRQGRRLDGRHRHVQHAGEQADDGRRGRHGYHQQPRLL